MEIKRYSTLPRSPELEPPYQIQFMSYLGYPFLLGILSVFKGPRKELLFNRIKMYNRVKGFFLSLSSIVFRIDQVD